MEKKLVTLQIEKMVAGGDGFSHHGTKACFVTGAIAGERVHAEIDQEKKQFLECTCTEVLNPSAFRQDPVCPVFTECGGCQWQHIRYDHQLYWKKKMVEEALSRIGKFRDVEVRTVCPSPNEYHYRNRVSLKLRHSPCPSLGFFRKKSHDVVDVKKCYIIPDALNEALCDLRNQLLTRPGQLKDTVQADLLFVSSENKTLLCLQDKTGKKSYHGCDADKPLYENVLGLYFRRDFEGFSQVNTDQNAGLIQYVTRLFEPETGDRLIDLYCGSGNFSLFLARQGAQVTGVDISRALIKKAAENARVNGIRGCRFETADLYQGGLHLTGNRVNGILLNPPRTGCSKQALLETARLKPPLMVYVSCNPATLARDLKILSEQGYYLDTIQPFDMFPQTCHIETVASMRC